MRPFATERVYVNYLGQVDDEGRERIKEAYGMAQYERLLALKKKCDPTNVFRLNQNINPLV
jgi:FAD/FMN-containing dehydrogenase